MRDPFLTIRAHPVGVVHRLCTLLAQDTMLARLGEDTAQKLLTLETQCSLPLLNALWKGETPVIRTVTRSVGVSLSQGGRDLSSIGASVPLVWTEGGTSALSCRPLPLLLSWILPAVGESPVTVSPAVRGKQSLISNFNIAR